VEKIIIRKEKETLKTRMFILLMSLIPIGLGSVLVFTSPVDFHEITFWYFFNILQGVITGRMYYDYGTSLLIGTFVLLIGIGGVFYVILSFFRRPKVILTVDAGGLKHRFLPLIPWNFINRVEHDEEKVISLELEHDGEAQGQLLDAIDKKFEKMEYDKATPSPPFVLEDRDSTAILHIELDLPKEAIETARNAIGRHKAVYRKSL